jgi:hypothetical protein
MLAAPSTADHTTHPMRWRLLTAQGTGAPASLVAYIIYDFARIRHSVPMKNAKLEQCRKKRDFPDASEPSGRIMQPKASAMPVFILLGGMPSE